MKEDVLIHFFSQEPFQLLEKHTALFIKRFEGKFSSELFLTSGLVCFELLQGNVCFDLKKYAGKSSTIFFPDIDKTLDFPPLEKWLSSLFECNSVGFKEDRTPLIYQSFGDNHYIYIQRYWSYENQLILAVQSRLTQSKLLSESNRSKNVETFLEKDSSLQKQVWNSLLTSRFHIISGGPGSGKTSLIVKIICYLIKNSLSQNNSAKYQYLLLAPTGKAATRLRQSILQKKEALILDKSIDEKLANLLHADAKTIHRVLDPIPFKSFFKYNENRKLHADCVIVDEVSMVDLALMTKLMNALPDHTKVIFLGDANQLPPVEAGDVLQEMIAYFRLTKSNENLIELKTSYRFDPSSGIGKLSQFINEQRVQEAFNFIVSQQNNAEQLRWDNLPSLKNLPSYLKARSKNFSNLYNSKNPEEAFEIYQKFVLLSSLKKGPYGADNLNQLMQKIIRHEFQIDFQTKYFHGMPILITKNDYHLELFNGDVGIIFERDKSGDKEVFFETESGLKSYPLDLISNFESAFALTVHKSQGSEYQEILFFLPPEKNELTTKELIYTGITRARKKVTIASTKESFKEAVGRKNKRNSGIYFKLSEIEN